MIPFLGIERAQVEGTAYLPRTRAPRKKGFNTASVHHHVMRALPPSGWCIMVVEDMEGHSGMDVPARGRRMLLLKDFFVHPQTHAAHVQRPLARLMLLIFL
jgi:hypothetical protein